MTARRLGSALSCGTLALLLAVGGCSSDSSDGAGAGDGPGDANDAANAGSAAGADAPGTGALAGDGSRAGAAPGGGSGAGGSGAAGSGSGLGGSPGGGANPATVPTFPGGGTSEAAQPLPGGMLCDSVDGDTALPVAPPAATCFSDPGAVDAATAATLEQVLECVEETNALHIRLTFHPWFVDNTYGANSIGWNPRRPHTFAKDLVKSDHAEIIIRDGAGNVVLQFKLDYVSEDPSKPSGYGSLGVTGGDGSVSVGDAADVLDWSTSIDRNLNERGYGDYIEDSPATDADYTPNPVTPEWDYRVVYEAWIDLSIFDGNSFEGATIEYVHASPAKSQSDTIEVEPGECPPPPGDDSPPGDDECLNAPDVQCGPETPPGGGGGTGGGGTPQDPCEDDDPDTFCNNAGVGGAGSGAGGTGGSAGDGAGGTGGGPPQGACNDNDPDTFCGPEGGMGGSGDPQYCTDHPDDPTCNVD